MANVAEIVQPKKRVWPVSFYLRKPYHHIKDGSAYGEAFVSIWDVHLASKADDLVIDGKTVRRMRGTFRRYLRLDILLFLLIFKWNFEKVIEKVDDKKPKGLADVLAKKDQQKKR